MDLIKPYFMTNEKWYYYCEKAVKLEDGNYFNYKLTSEGEKIPKVVESYKRFIKDLEKDA